MSYCYQGTCVTALALPPPLVPASDARLALPPLVLAIAAVAPPTLVPACVATLALPPPLLTDRADTKAVSEHWAPSFVQGCHEADQ